jgi:hypothetical protein
MEHLIWFYNKSGYKSPGNLSPIDYVIKSYPESHMAATHTFRLIFIIYPVK